jgi:hypothetical protein
MEAAVGPKKRELDDSMEEISVPKKLKGEGTSEVERRVRFFKEIFYPLNISFYPIRNEIRTEDRPEESAQIHRENI